MQRNKWMIKVLLILGVLTIGARQFINEFGNYCEELNPYNDDLIKDMGSDFDCNDCSTRGEL